MIVFDNVSYAHPQTDHKVFENLSLIIPDGIISLIGQNGTGKSTLLLLAGGRLLPDAGTVLLDGRDTKTFGSEEDRARFAAFIYQNMEFENEEPVESLLSFVFENGFYDTKDFSFVDELVDVFELERCLGLKIDRLSKGEMQRLILAFSLLYGSKNILMDEPVFALEEYQKKRAMEYVTAFARKKNINVLYSLHELDLSEKYSEHLLLFYKKDRPPRLGLTKELFKRELIEEAYDVPFDALKRRESIFRDGLIRLDEVRQRHIEEREKGVSAKKDDDPDAS